MKPENITLKDWELLKEKYSDNLSIALTKLNQNYPIQYLIGFVDFYDCHIKVDERVLIPRFETELLVDKLIKKLSSSSKPLKILDLGCGSGCISIALKKNIDCQITAIDNSLSALALAQENAQINHTPINFQHNTIENTSYENYQVIVSNPPYVSYDEEVDEKTLYEPVNALYARNNGLYFYYKIIDKIKLLASKPFLIAFEIGMTQAPLISDYANKFIPEYQITIEKDLTGKNRYLFLNLISE